MPIKLDHTIVHAHDPRASAEFLVDLFGLPAPVPFGPFLEVHLDGDLTLAFLSGDGMEIQGQHYAFLVSDGELDEILGRIRTRGLPFWADPACKEAGEINHHFGGRGLYFRDPSGHLLEIITRRYGDWSEIGR